VTYSEWRQRRDSSRPREDGKAIERRDRGSVVDLQAIRAQIAAGEREVELSRGLRARLAAALAGGAVSLRTVDLDGRPVKDALPRWTEYIQREREAGRLPLASIMERARAAGDPVRDAADYRRKKLIYGGGDAA
jgi:hypothetical protein